MLWISQSLILTLSLAVKKCLLVLKSLIILRNQRYRTSFKERRWKEKTGNAKYKIDKPL
jgi:hypothetical protein